MKTKAAVKNVLTTAFAFYVLPTELWYLLELNQGHMDFQSIALPPELRYLALLLSMPTWRAIGEKRVQR